MVYFNTSIRGNEVMLTKLQSIFQEPVYMDNELVEDVETELKQAHLTVNIYSDILTGTMDAFASIISNNVNTIMKRMTSISIILMVPTPHRQLLRYERPDLRRKYAAWLCHHRHDLHHTISFIIFHFQKDQMVLN